MITDKIHDLNIYDVIAKYAGKITKSGANFKTCCPIHNEKTPSFTIFPASNTFKCFGCGAGGDAIAFIMQLKNLDFIEACKIISHDHNLNLDFKDEPKPDPELSLRRETFFSILKAAQQEYVNQLTLPENEHALKYISNRFSLDIIQKWSIGYAPDDWHFIHNKLTAAGFKQEDLLNIGLLSDSNGKVFDTFRSRIMFPITDEHGRVIAFSGRIFNQPDDSKAPKYINSPESIIYKKHKSLFGLSTALAEIRKTKSAYLVEGNPDVIRLQEVGPKNTIAPLGTALTEAHIDFIAKNCTSAAIIGDSDAAGQKAIVSHAKDLIKRGLFVNVIPLPEPKSPDEKIDPDSFFAENNFSEYAEKNNHDFIMWMANKYAEPAKRPDVKQSVITQISELVSCFSASAQEIYIEQLAKLIKPKKAWTDELKAITKLIEPTKENTQKHDILPDHVDANSWEEYRFYEDNNQYFFRTKNGIVRGSNFSLKPLFHVQSVIDSKRLFIITNVFGYSQVIELAQKDLISLQAFRLRVESLGNFLWEASEIELNLLKRVLYENTNTCTEIKQLGWQKHGFWAWANGIFDGKEFVPVDDYGIVSFNRENYYIPAFSKIYQREDSLFISERKFIHMPGTISMLELVDKLVNVFGPNAQISYCFLLAACFRDVIANRFGFFPILNLFGPKGAGKTEMAVFMLRFFGKVAKGPNINNTSKAALADHVAQYSNALCHIDEYKNSLEMEKQEFIKGIWDGTGRTRMNMDKDKKKETTNVDIALMISGQEMPTADIATFSRMLFLTFTQTEYSDLEKNNFSELKTIVDAGITHLTHQILALRKHFAENFFDYYDLVCSEVTKLLGDQIIEDRIFRNWSIILSAFYTLKDRIITNIEWSKLLQLSVALIIRQNSETKKTNDVATFWDFFSYLVKERELTEDVDFRVSNELSLKLMDNKEFQFDTLEPVLYLNHTRVFDKYRAHGAKTRDNVLPKKTLEYYLINSKEYLGKKASCPFLMKDGDSGDYNTSGNRRRQITTSHTFHYRLLKENYGISVVSDEIDNNDQILDKNSKISQNPVNQLFHENEKNDLPF